MMTVILSGWALRRPSDLLNSLAAAAFIILLWDPQQLFLAGIQLSFGVVLGLAILLPPLLEIRNRLLPGEPWMPHRLRSRWNEWTRRRISEGLAALATSVAAWFGAYPWIAWHFYLVSGISLLANLAIIPLSWVVMVCGISSLLSAWLPWIPEGFNRISGLCMALMISVSDRLADLPGAWGPAARPSRMWMIAYIGLLLTPLVADGMLKRLRWAGICLVALGLAWAAPRWHARHHARIVVLPVGGGDSIWLDLPGRENDFLVDTGDSRAVERIVQPFLQAQGIRDLPGLVLSHGDVRHVGGVTNLVPNFPVQHVHAGSLRGRSKAFQAGIQFRRGSAKDVHLVARRAQIGRWTVLHPAVRDAFSQADDQAVVLSATVHGIRLLLCSDLGRLGQQVLLEREPGLRADIVVAGMPSSAEPLSDALLDALHPRVMILSTGDYPPSQQASRALRIRLARRHLPTYFSGDQGAVTIALNPASWEVRSMDATVPATGGSPYHGRESGPVGP
jgi:competence protein ComEC